MGLGGICGCGKCSGADDDDFGKAHLEALFTILPHLAIRIGDLRLQALCSYATFKDYDLAKRCLYLFAGMPFNDEGLLCACVYEKPKPYFGGNCIGEPVRLPNN